MTSSVICYIHNYFNSSVLTNILAICHLVTVSFGQNFQFQYHQTIHLDEAKLTNLENHAALGTSLNVHVQSLISNLEAVRITFIASALLTGSLGLNIFFHASHDTIHN